MNVVNIHAIYKGKGEKTDLESERGIFIVSILRTILMKMVYNDIYDKVDSIMSDSNIGARKGKNIRNHIFVVNSIMFDGFQSKKKKTVDVMVLDFKQMFDSEWLQESLNDLYEAGVCDDYLPLIYKSNREAYVAVKTPGGLSKRETVKEIVMQGDVLAPLLSSLHVDAMVRNCMEESKIYQLFKFKDKVPIPPLGMVDDLLTITNCGHQTVLMNNYVNNKAALKRLQFGTKNSVKLHIGSSCSKVLCPDLFVDSWKVVADKSGKTHQKDDFVGQEKMTQKTEQMYLGDILSCDGKQDKNIEARKNKGIGIIAQIMSILESTMYGKYYFEVAMVLRNSLFLSSVLLNSEAWINLSKNNIRKLEQVDEML